MELLRFAPSAVVAAFPSGLRILYSFDAPVAAFVPGRGWVRAARYISRTTEGHIREFMKDATARNGATVEVLPQEEVTGIALEAK